VTRDRGVGGGGVGGGGGGGGTRGAAALRTRGRDLVLIIFYGTNFYSILHSIQYRYHHTNTIFEKIILGRFSKMSVCWSTNKSLVCVIS